MDADLDSMLPTASGVIDLTDLDSDCVSALVQRMPSIVSILSKTYFNFSIENCHAAVWEIVEQFTRTLKACHQSCRFIRKNWRSVVTH